jgi:ADP-ribose pyrophosphatase YjhB (NUDIX family)
MIGGVAYHLLVVTVAVSTAAVGADFLLFPSFWLPWLPEWLKAASPLKDTPLLYTIGTLHIILAGLVFLPKYRRVTSVLVALCFASAAAVAPAGMFAIVVRDIGLAGAALTLALAARRRREEAVGVVAPPTASSFHVGAVCVQQTPEGVLEVLAGKRSGLKRHYPGFWEGTAGGAMRPGESFEDGALRHLREDYGVEARVLQMIAPFEIPAAGKDPAILGVKFLCEFSRFVNGSNVSLDESEYTEWRWVREDALGALEWIAGIPRNAKEDIREAMEMFRRKLEIGN